MDFRGMRALVTGASSGIGTHFAERLAADGADLVLVARRADALEALAARLRQAHGVTVDVLPTDLGEPDAVAGLVERLDAAGLTVDVLVNNAGFGQHTDVADADPARLVAMVTLNCTALVELTARLVPGMVARRRGGVLNVASTAAFQPLPHMATYGATKAFVLSFTEALWAETRGTGVHVTALCPGATATEFFDVSGGGAVGAKQSADEVAALGLAALRANKPSVVAGLRNRLLAQTPRFFPRGVTALVTERAMAGSREA